MTWPDISRSQDQRKKGKGRRGRRRKKRKEIKEEKKKLTPRSPISLNGCENTDQRDPCLCLNLGSR